MRTLTILGVGFVLGATLGFGGLWKYVIVPAKEEIVQLEEDNQIMHGALVEAQTTLEDEADRISLDFLPIKLPKIGGVNPAGIMPAGIAPEAATSTKKTEAQGDKEAAERLKNMADKLNTITSRHK
ncbi:MAG: hypothetical protein L3J82_03550 [Planctomycetes bacterium]|nr:hypothetical protein [Planctomycetota bacterium]